MPVTTTLSTVPGKITRQRGHDLKTLEYFGPSLESETVPNLTNVAQITTAVHNFGTKLRAHYPDTSFYVSVTLPKGARKPNGYDAARNENGFGQNNFLRIEDGRDLKDFTL